jgi:hypothetical protein
MQTERGVANTLCEVHGLTGLQCQRRNAVHLIPVGHAAVIFPP